MEMRRKIPKVPVPFKNESWNHPIFAGTVKKKGGILPVYKKKFFILTLDGKLFIFKNRKKKLPQNLKKPVMISERYFRRTDRKTYCIKIEKYPKHLYFKLPSSDLMLKWLEKLSIAGGMRREKEITKKIKKKSKEPEIGQREVKNWNNKNVLEWLKYNSLGREPFTIYSEQFKDIAGIDLVQMTEDKLEKIGIDNYPHRKKIMRAIKEVIETKTFNYREHNVYSKIENMTKGIAKSGGKGNWKFLAKSLADVKNLKETYLNPSVLQDSFDKYIPEDLRNEKEDEDDEDEDLLREDTDDGEGPVEEPVPIDQANALPVKLVVTEMVHNNNYKTARKLLSPVINKLPKFQKEFGVFHTALIVGPWYLEWTDSSLVIPRKLYSGMALVSADIDTTSLIKNMSVDEISTKLAQVICRWNTTMSYANVNFNDNPHAGNCQEFVEDCMEALGISLNKDGAFGRFLEQMKIKGKCEMSFVPSKEFKSKFGLSLNSYTFDTHQELDEFYFSCQKKDAIALQMDFKDEHKLLKSFDRAFWLRHFKKPGESKFKPADKCPFKDPRETQSYMTYK